METITRAISSWTGFFFTRALIGLLPGAVAWTCVSGLLAMLHTR